MAAALADSNSTPLSSLSKLVQLAGLSENAGMNVTINGSDPVWPTRYKVVESGGGGDGGDRRCRGRLWALKTGKATARAYRGASVAAALRSRVICASTARGRADPDNITGFYQLRDGRWMYLHCNFSNLRDGTSRCSARRAKRDAVAGCRQMGRARARERDLRTRRRVQLRAQRRGVARAAADAHGRESAAVRDHQDRRGAPDRCPTGDRPLSGIRVLDLTRVLAGRRARARLPSMAPMSCA